jgi:hypothetical protein
MPPEQFNEERLACQEIARKEKSRHEITDWMHFRPDGQRVITEYFNDLAVIEQLQKTAMQLAGSKLAPTKEDRNGSGKVTIRLTNTGKAMVALGDAFDPLLPARHRHHVFNPWIKAMMVALLHWHTGVGFGMAFSGKGILPEDRDNLNRIARFVRRACHSPVFHRRIQEGRRLAKQNLRSACAYMCSLFARHSRLLILRIDLYYQGEGREWSHSNEAKAAFERFVRALRTGRIVPDVLGYLASREDGPERSAHFHLLVVLDGHKRKDADGHTRQIGEHWETGYTGPGRGTFFNCYARRDEYEYNGLGLVHVSDWKMLIGIREALRYMTKPEHLVKVKNLTQKCFRRGLIKRADVKLGAPRHPGNGMSAVLRILGGAARGRDST